MVEGKRDPLGNLIENGKYGVQIVPVREGLRVGGNLIPMSEILNVELIDKDTFNAGTGVTLGGAGLLLLGTIAGLMGALSSLATADAFFSVETKDGRTLVCRAMAMNFRHFHKYFKIDKAQRHA